MINEEHGPEPGLEVDDAAQVRGGMPIKLTGQVGTYCAWTNVASGSCGGAKKQ
jgi:hypothetical protein